MSVTPSSHFSLPDLINTSFVTGLSVVLNRCYQSVRNDINPVFRRHSYPDLQIKIGMAEGENIVIQYGKDKSSQIDLIGYIINVTSKITSLTLPDRISMGGAFHMLLHPKTQSEFEKISLENREWKYIDKHNQKIYEVYSTKYTHS